MALIDYEFNAGVATVTLNRPERLNAMDNALSGELRERLRTIDRDPDVRAIIVTGAGDRAFSSGMDLRSDRVAPAGGILLGEEDEEYVPLTLLKVRKPTIAAIKGYALAGGLDLALACDLRIMSRTAQAGFPEVHWNFSDGFAAALITRMVPMAHAMDMLLRAHRVDADYALRIGLVNEVVEPDAVLSRAGELASELAAQAPLAIRAMKEMVYQTRYADLAQIMSSQGKYMRLLGLTEDGAEGRVSFPERRAPIYKGR